MFKTVSISPAVMPKNSITLTRQVSPAVRFGSWQPEGDEGDAQAAKTLLTRMQRFRALMEQLGPALRDIVQSPHLEPALRHLGELAPAEEALLKMAARELDTESGGKPQHSTKLTAAIATSSLSDEALTEIDEAHFQNEQGDNPFYQEVFGDNPPELP